MAVVSALALVALVAILTIGIAWLGHLSISRAQVQRDAGQAAYLAEAVQEYARWVLTADIRGEAGGSAIMDHLAEPWAQPIPHSRLDLLFGAQMSADDRRRFANGAVAGGFTDEQGRLNLAAVADELRVAQTEQSSGGSPPSAATDSIGKATARFLRLLSLLGVSRAGQETLLAWVSATAQEPPVSGNTYWLALHRAITDFPDLTEEDRSLLADRLVWLPESTKINVNTADRFIVMAALDDSDVRFVDAIIERRERIPFRSVAELLSLLPAGSSHYMSVFDVKSSYFRLRGYAQFGQAESEFFTLFFRQNQRVFRIDEWLTQ